MISTQNGLIFFVSLFIGEMNLKKILNYWDSSVVFKEETLAEAKYEFLRGKLERQEEGGERGGKRHFGGMSEKEEYI